MPVVFGLPPVINAVPPGSESDGFDVAALVYSLPVRVSSASVECGWWAMYQSRSLWCMPSTEISSTCLLACAPLRAGEALAGRPDNAHIATAPTAVNPIAAGRWYFDMVPVSYTHLRALETGRN